MMGREEEWITPWERVLFIQDKEKESVLMWVAVGRWNNNKKMNKNDYLKKRKCIINDLMLVFLQIVKVYSYAKIDIKF